jgi:hypothetical protein
VEEVKRTAIIASVMFLLFSSSCFSELIDPPPLKVRRVCGVAMVAGAELELKRATGHESFAKVRSDKDGKFDFGAVPVGLYRLSMTWPDSTGQLQGPIHNTYPIKVTGTSGVGCKRPLWVGELTGSGWESGLNVSFGSENQ